MLIGIEGPRKICQFLLWDELKTQMSWRVLSGGKKAGGGEETHFACLLYFLISISVRFSWGFIFFFPLKHILFFFPFTWVGGFCTIYETATSPDLEKLVLRRRLKLLVQTCPSFGLFPKPLGLSKQPCLFLVVPSGGDCAETYQCLPGWQGTLVST